MAKFEQILLTIVLEGTGAWKSMGRLMAFSLASLTVVSCASLESYVAEEKQAVRAKPYLALSVDGFPPMLEKACGGVRRRRLLKACVLRTIEVSIGQLQDRFPAASVDEVSEMLDNGGREKLLEDYETRLADHFDDLVKIPELMRLAVAWVYLLEDNFRESHAVNLAKRRFAGEDTHREQTLRELSSALERAANQLRSQAP